MIVKKMKVIDEAGMHARPVSQLTKVASDFDGEVNFIYNDKKVNGKSIMMIMALGIKQGSEFTLELNGEKEEELWEKLKEILIVEKVAEEI